MLTPTQQAAYDELCRLLPAPGTHAARLPGGKPLPPRPAVDDDDPTGYWGERAELAAFGDRASDRDMDEAAGRWEDEQWRQGWTA